MLKVNNLTPSFSNYFYRLGQLSIPLNVDKVGKIFALVMCGAGLALTAAAFFRAQKIRQEEQEENHYLRINWSLAHLYFPKEPPSSIEQEALSRIWHQCQRLPQNTFNVRCEHKRIVFGWDKDSNSIVIVIDENKKIGIQKNTREEFDIIDESPNTQLSAEFQRHCIQFCYYRCLYTFSEDFHLTTNSEKQSLLKIAVLRNSVKKLSGSQLFQFIVALRKHMQQVVAQSKKTPRLEVFFQHNNLDFDRTTDWGGVTKAYVSEMMEGLVQNKSLFFKIKDSGLVFPELADVHSDFREPCQILYRSIGSLFMQILYPGTSDPFVIGRLFDHALFIALLRLRSQDLGQDFNSLPLQRKLDLCQALIEARSGTNGNMDYLLKRIQLLSKQNHSDQELREAAAIAMETDFCEEYLDEEEPNNIEQIKQNLSAFWIEFENTLFEIPTSFGCLGKQIQAIHAIAQGMKEWYCQFFVTETHLTPTQKDQKFDQFWANTRKPIDLESIIQGSIDRKAIIDSFKLDARVINDPTIQMKFQWLKEWIEKEATEEEVRLFLIYATGAPSLSLKKTIGIDSQYEQPYSPTPIANTCSPSLLFASDTASYGRYTDASKDDFIKCFKEIALVNATAYSKE